MYLICRYVFNSVRLLEQIADQQFAYLQLWCLASAIYSYWHVACILLHKMIKLLVPSPSSTGRLQTAFLVFKSPCGETPFVSCRQLQAHCWLRTPLSVLDRHQRSHCSANLHSAWRQEFFGGRTESIEQCSHHTAKTWHWICAVQTTFKGISVWWDRGALATFCL